jgi:hypothetical protein
MTPDEAKDYYEDDEDPADIERRFQSSAEGGFTAPPAPTRASGQVTRSANFRQVTAVGAVGTGLYGHLGTLSVSSGGRIGADRGTVQA